jgi:hypothetical protein
MLSDIIYVTVPVTTVTITPSGATLLSPGGVIVTVVTGTVI